VKKNFIIRLKLSRSTVTSVLRSNCLGNNFTMEEKQMAKKKVAKKKTAKKKVAKKKAKK
jgi:hypothetical protein